MQITEIINTIGQVATAIAVFVAIWAIWQNGQINRKQANMQVFLTYTDRFDKIMQSFPANAFQARYNLDDANLPQSKELTLAVIKYLNMTSEEYYLYRCDYLDKAVWQIWETEIKRTLCSQLIRREWPKVEHEYVSYKEFGDYVRDVQRETR